MADLVTRFEKRERKSNPTNVSYHFMGYSSLYNFYYFPDKVRMRLRSVILSNAMKTIFDQQHDLVNLSFYHSTSEMGMAACVQCLRFNRYLAHCYFWQLHCTTLYIHLSCDVLILQSWAWKIQPKHSKNFVTYVILTHCSIMIITCQKRSVLRFIRKAKNGKETRAMELALIKEAR